MGKGFVYYNNLAAEQKAAKEAQAANETPAKR